MTRHLQLQPKQIEAAHIAERCKQATFRTHSHYHMTVAGNDLISAVGKTQLLRSLRVRTHTHTHNVPKPRTDFFAFIKSPIPISSASNRIKTHRKESVNKIEIMFGEIVHRLPPNWLAIGFCGRQRCSYIVDLQLAIASHICGQVHTIVVRLIWKAPNGSMEVVNDGTDSSREQEQRKLILKLKK